MGVAVVQGFSGLVVSSPWLKSCAGMAILICALSILVLAVVPLIGALR